MEKTRLYDTISTNESKYGDRNTGSDFDIRKYKTEQKTGYRKSDRG